MRTCLRFVATWIALLAASGCVKPAADAEPEPPANDEPLACTTEAPAAAPMRLLTRVQYDNTVADLLGDASRPSELFDFPKEHLMLGFDNNAEAHRVTPLLVERYLQAAEHLAARAVETRLAELAPCVDQSEPECGRSFVRSFVARAFRRPPSADELGVFDGIFTRFYSSKGYAEGVGAVIETVLQSPQFLYRVDAPTQVGQGLASVPVTGYEMASRLSYLLWNSMPDEELLAAAAANELSTAEQVEARARSMLASPRARAMVADFNRQWLGLDRFDGFVRQSEGAMSVDVTGDALRESLVRFMDEVYWQAGDLQALFSSPALYVNPALAALLGLDAPADDFVRVEAPETRSGLLTQPGLMALLAHPDQTSPIQRGVFVRELLLCDLLPDPPPSVDQSPPPADPNATTRERVDQLTSGTTCINCHQRINPIGFAFEAYDQYGRYRTEENGLPLDLSGEIAALDDPELAGAFDGATELGQRLATSARVRDCLALHWFRYAMGRAETELDRCSLDQLRTRFRSAEGDLEELLVALTQTDAFRFRAPAPEAP